MSPQKKLLGIFAPYPRLEYLSDGWYRRIKLIDSILEGIPRVYINTIHEAGRANSIVRFPNGVREIFINPRAKHHAPEDIELLRHISLGYIHTSHIGEDFLSLNLAIPFIIDFHGVAPEEELSLGNSKKSEALEKSEKVLYLESLMRIFVSPGMQKHFQEKYNSELFGLQLPIISDIRLAEFTKPDAAIRSSKDSFVYSGGLQPWQNIPEMMEVAKSLGKPLTVATNQIAEFKRLYEKSENHFLKLGTYPSNELLKVYTDASFGYVLRNDSVVNRVSFPTKLFEYIASGVIPVVKFDDLGGLSEFGIFSVSLDQLTGNSLSAEELTNGRVKNFEISQTVAQGFLSSAATLRNEIVSAVFDGSK